MIDNHLFIFIKNPQLGKTKTRLAKTVGDDIALEIYISLTNYTRHVAMKTPVHRSVFYSDFIDDHDEWNPNIFHKFKQEGHDLGDRMSKAFAEVLQDSSKGIIIGSDCPGITPTLLKTAFEKLDHHDIVIGPSTDGGYYLLGMKLHQDSLFRNIDWSSRFVLQQTISKIEELDLSYFLLKPMTDIDQEADWNKNRHLLKNISRDLDADHIFHVADAEVWTTQKNENQYVIDSLKKEGFIHCCYNHQFDHVLSSYFSKGQKLVILRLDPLQIKPFLKIEKAGDKGFFPHIYAPIEKPWILSVEELIHDPS